MSCLSKTLIEDVSLSIGEQLQYIGFVQQTYNGHVLIDGAYYKTVCGITINVRLGHRSKDGRLGTRISLDWRDVIDRHLVGVIFVNPTLDSIDGVVRKLSDGALNIHIEGDKPMDAI